jgi:lysozyme
MKIRFLKILAILSAAILLISGYLLHNRKIWFVYPDKNIYSVDGLDISHHQGEVDWEKVDKKYQFVFIKATEGNDFIDKRFYENAERVKNTHRILGAYHFFHFNYGGLEQANNYINTVGNIIDLPPVVDFEFTGNPEKFDKQKVYNELIICIDTLEKYYGHKVIIYTTKDAYTHFIKTNFNNPIWYRSIIFSLNKNIKNVLFWQYHNSATIEGINTKVDLNVFKGDILALKRLIMKYGNI